MEDRCSYLGPAFVFFSFGDILWNGYGCPSTGNMEVTISDMVRDLQYEAYEYIHGKAGGEGGFT